MSKKQNTFDICFIGAGHLGHLILDSMLDKKKKLYSKTIAVHVKTLSTAKKLKKKYPKISLSTQEKLDSPPPAKCYIIAVKPQHWNAVKEDLKKIIPQKSFVISIMAGLSASKLESDLNRPAVVAMTNTSLQVNKALTSMFKSPSVSRIELAFCKNIFSSFGGVYELPENLFHKATALGASHPAFVLKILQSTVSIVQKELGIKNPHDWVVNVFEGALALAKKEKNIDKLLTQIATPGGCTQEGLKSLDDQKISDVLYHSFEACWNKAQTLSQS